MKYLGIIPARIGSKRVPFKNIRKLNGMPLVEWTLVAARDSKYLNETYISSDSEEIIEIGKKNGAQSHGIRPNNLSGDQTPTLDVVLDILKSYSDQGIEIENIVLLQPTSPLRNSKDIDDAIEFYETNDSIPLQSYSKAECPPQWLYKIGQDNIVVRSEDQLAIRSQDLGDYYRINGAIYIISVKTLNDTKTFTPKHSIAYLMPRERSIDIDEEIDFRIAEKISKES